MKRRVNSNSDGQTRYFGPTSSLHLTETPSSISSYSNNLSCNDIDLTKGIPEALQQYLLELYWSYQHSVLPLVHKEAFLDSLQTGRGPYYSRSLLLSILASGARISARPDIRAYAIPTDDDEKNEPRPLMKLAEEALEKESRNPSITTIQSLLLLSVMHCTFTRGPFPVLRHLLSVRDTLSSGKWIFTLTHLLTLGAFYFRHSVQ